MTTTTRQTWFQDCLQQMDQALYGPSQAKFPFQIEWGDRQYQFPIWQGEQLPDALLAYDTETTVARENKIPQLALAAVHGDSGSSYFVHPQDLPAFIQRHSQAYYVAHNATFDFWVTAQALQGDPQTLAIWWDIAGDSRLMCTMLLDCLVRLAHIDAEPIGRDLATVAAEYCELELDKSDPFRTRYGELIGLPVTAWKDMEAGFWQYAAKDPIATLLVAQQQFQIAQQLIGPYRDELLPGAIRRFGPLTACLQVQGSIALDYISKTGVCIDLEQARRAHREIAEQVAQQSQVLEELAIANDTKSGDSLFANGVAIFKRVKKTGQIKRTRAGVPQRNAKVIKQLLELFASNATIRPPRNKDGLVTDSVAYWKQHQDLDPFIAAYVKFSEQGKLMQFFGKLNQNQIYPRYRPLVRTGRTSCHNPNLQQLPRDARFREMIIAPPGYYLLQVDFSVLELRTLAQICLRRYGRSVLAELFEQGVDPHRYTAALLLGKTLEQFDQLPPREQKRHRQRAKAINFGVPGALGVESLVAYAKQSYGVTMSFENARAFRQKLIKQIYPELSAYLKDQPYHYLASNLNCKVAAARRAFAKPQQMRDAHRIISGYTETMEDEEYPAELIQYIWQFLQLLNNNEQLATNLKSQQPSLELARRIFWGHALSISGRLRGHVGFSQRMNTPFQSLAADGNKLALFRLLRHGFQVCGFIHDEMLVLIPDGTDYDVAVAQVQKILCSSMQEFTPNISIETSFLLADRWYKDVDEQPRDEQGRIVPYTKTKGPLVVACGNTLTHLPAGWIPTSP